jgi:probable rRNA maturation factor
VNVFIANEQELPVDEERLVALARHTLRAEEVGRDAELSVLLVASDHMQRLNARFAGNDHATDVLAFPMMEDADEEDATLLGDVVICPQVGVENARRIGHDLDQELDTLLIHGTLHLLGYDHQGKADKALMDRRLREVLSSFGPATADG